MARKRKNLTRYHVFRANGMHETLRLPADKAKLTAAKSDPLVWRILRELGDVCMSSVVVFDAPERRDAAPSLNEALAALGFTTAPANRGLAFPTGAKHIIRDGQVEFTGSAHEVWQWLRDCGLIEGKDGIPVASARNA